MNHSPSDTKIPKSRFLFLPLLLFLLAVPLLSASSAHAGPSQAPASGLERQVRSWAAVLSAQKSFAEWKDASPDIQALGPGTHGWLAVLNKNGQPVGYMVIHAAADGTFRLGEYGMGPNVLFSPATLSKTLLENGLIGSKSDSYDAVRHYYHPFAAAWEVAIGSESYWIDAKTGEILPFDREGWQKVLPSLRPEFLSIPDGSDVKVTKSWMKESFDPYENLPWLTGEPPFSPHNGKEMQHRLLSGVHLRYVTEPYGDAALYAVPVVGFQSWSDGRLDVAVDMDGNRFIPLDSLRKDGRFYE